MAVGVIKIRPQDLPRGIMQRTDAVKKAILTGTVNGAMRGRAILVRETPVDQGQLRASWKVRQRILGNIIAELFNDAPHAGIVEAGARPHPVNRAGIFALTRWAWRNRGLFGLRSLEEAQGVAFAVAKKIALRGQVGKFFVRKQMHRIETAMRREVERSLNKLARRRVER